MSLIKTELMIQLITQSNENLRATDSRKNQLYYFFIILLGFYITGYKDISSSPMSIVFNLFISIVGISFVFLIIKYQERHLICVYDSIMIQKIIHRYNRDENKIVLNREILESIFSDILSEQKRVLNSQGTYSFISKHGSEFFLYNSFVIIDFLSMFLLLLQILKIYTVSSFFYKSSFYLDVLDKIKQYPYNSMLLSAVIFSSCLALYIILLNKIRWGSLELTKKEYLDKSWVIAGFR